MVFHGSRLVFQVGFHGFSWFWDGFYGFSWFQVDFHGCGLFFHGSRFMVHGEFLRIPA